MATEPAAEHAPLEGPAAFEDEAAREQIAGLGPWKLGLRRLRRNKVALAFGFLFVLLVAVCVAAPLWANQVAHTSPTENHLSDTIKVDGETKNGFLAKCKTFDQGAVSTFFRSLQFRGPERFDPSQLQPGM